MGSIPNFLHRQPLRLSLFYRRVCSETPDVPNYPKKIVTCSIETKKHSDMKRLFYLSMMALMMLAAVSCDKEGKPQEPVNPLPSTVWSQSWDSMVGGVKITYKATLVFEDKTVRFVLSAMDLQLDGMPTIIYGSSGYVFERTADGGGQVSFSLPVQSTTALGIPETTYSGSYNPDSAVLTLNIAEVDGMQPFALNLIKESKLTMEMNPFPATIWTASWVSGVGLIKAFLSIIYCILKLLNNTHSV